MKSIKILLLIACMAILVTGAYASWTFDKAVGPIGESCQFIDVDTQGDVWVTDYAVPGTPQIFVFTAAGDIATTIGVGQMSGAPQALLNMGGVACDTDNGIVYIVNYADKQILKFDDTTNAPMDGIDLAGVTPNSPGDVDIITSGSKNWVVLVNKVSAEWGILDPDILAPIAYQVQFGIVGWHVNRGVGVNNTTKDVYIADESSHIVAVWNQTGPETWVQGANLDTTPGGQSACEVDAGGYVYVSRYIVNEIECYDSSHVLVETITDQVIAPRGCGFGASKLYNVRFDSAQQVLGIYDGASGITDWVEY